MKVNIPDVFDVQKNLDIFHFENSKNLNLVQYKIGILLRRMHLVVYVFSVYLFLYTGSS